MADPSALLASVATAAGIGRTTLHKKYAARQALLVAVEHRSLHPAEQAVRVPDPAAPDAPDRLIAALIPVGPQLAFLFRRPSPDADAEIAAVRSRRPDRLPGAGRRDARAAPGRHTGSITIRGPASPPVQAG